MAIENTSTIWARNDNYRSYETRDESDIQYIVVHYTGTINDTAEGEASYFANNYVGASAHVFVDEDTICHSVPYCNRAWAVGANEDEYKHPYCRNWNSVSIEMCTKMDDDGNYYINPTVVSNTIDLVHELMDRFNVDIDHVLMHAGPHPDSVVVPEVKLCPAPFQNDWAQWDDFKNRLIHYGEQPEESEEKIEEDEEMTYNSIDEVPEYGRDIIKNLIEKEVIRGDADGKLNLTESNFKMFIYLNRLGLLNR